MVTIDRFEEMAQAAADELPDCFFTDLNGGVAILDRAKPHPRGTGDDLWIMGEYSRGPMGKVIYLYYGSFARVYDYLSDEALQEEVRRVVRHEFRHHLEGLAGERGLEAEDERQIRAYLDSRG